MIHSDLHMHSEASYDSKLPIEAIYEAMKENGFSFMGITDHANYNDTSFLGDIKHSAEIVKEFQKTHSGIILGVELTPIEKPEFDYIAKTGTREGYVPPVQSTPYDIELAMTKEEMILAGIKQKTPLQVM